MMCESPVCICSEPVQNLNNNPRSKLRGIPVYEVSNGEASFGELNPKEIKAMFIESEFVSAIGSS